MSTSTAAPKSPPEPRGGGRPRDPRLDGAILKATHDLLIEVGYADLTIGAIAARAGTTKPAIYRRWPSKMHLVHDVVMPSEEITALPETGSLATDVAAMVREVAQLFGSPVARAGFPGLLADLVSNPELHANLNQAYESALWAAVDTLLDRARRKGELAKHVQATTLVEAIGGAAFLAILWRPDDINDAWVRSLTALILHGAESRS